MTTKRYKLKATLAGLTRSITFSAFNDDDATLEATAIILDSAMGSETWARGAIELRGPDGTVIHSMEEK